MTDGNPILHTTGYLNAMVSHCKTPYFFVCDSDIIVKPEVVLGCVRYLSSANHRVLAYPYNGDFYDIPKEVRKGYAASGDYNVLKDKEDRSRLWFQYSTGGIFGGRTMDFKCSGPDNENIYGWGPDDRERYYRLKKEGFTIGRADTPLYHLYHERKVNSWHANNEIRKKNELEYLIIFMDA